jgi:hypothetical protein
MSIFVAYKWMQIHPRGLEQVYVSFCVGNSSPQKRIKKGTSYLWVELAAELVGSHSWCTNWRLASWVCTRSMEHQLRGKQWSHKQQEDMITKHWNGLEYSCWLIDLICCFLLFPSAGRWRYYVVTVAAEAAGSLIGPSSGDWGWSAGRAPASGLLSVWMCGELHVAASIFRGSEGAGGGWCLA